MIQNVFREKVIHLFCGSKKFYIPIICLTVWDFHLSNPKQLFSMNNTKPLFIVRKHDKSLFSSREKLLRLLKPLGSFEDMRQEKLSIYLVKIVNRL